MLLIDKAWEDLQSFQNKLTSRTFETNAKPCYKKTHMALFTIGSVKLG